MDSERRREPRFRVAENLSFITPILHINEIEYMAGDGRVENRSSRGICLTTNIPLDVGDVLRVICFSPFMGLVKWVVKENPHSYKIGLEKR